MRIYFYHTRLTAESYEAWKDYKFPGHLLYGQPLFEQYGIDSVMHPYKAFDSRWRLMWYATRKILACRRSYDVLYGTSFRGLELIILLRALGLYRKPIVIWHHQSIRTNRNRWRECLSRLFYRGIDHMFFFSRRLIADSLPAHKAAPEKLQLVHWGPDLAFYDHIRQDLPVSKRGGFISTGKENRDVSTMLQAFAAADQPLDVYIARTNGDLDYTRVIDALPASAHIRIHYTEGVIPRQLAQEVVKRRCIVICCLDYPYTVGLTTLVEAFALGMPVICSRNPYFEPDIDQERIGITVPYGDTEGWRHAIDYIASHPAEAEEMGRNARRLAEKQYNLEIFAREVAESLLKIAGRKAK